MTISIEINTDNAAFDENFITEMTYVVNQIPQLIVKSDGGNLRDSYGNTVGEVKVEL